MSTASHDDGSTQRSETSAVDEVLLPSWAAALKSITANIDDSQEGLDADAAEGQQEIEVKEYMNQILSRTQAEHQASSSRSAVAGGIPTFFKQRPKEGSLAERLQRAAYFKHLKVQSDLFLDREELELLWLCLRDNISGPDEDGGPEMINYEDFGQVASICIEQIGPKVSQFFKPSVFQMFEIDAHGRIAVLQFYLYIMRVISISQARVDLCSLDNDCDGYLTYEEVEAYIYRLVPNLAPLRRLEVMFVGQYCRMAARKFFFFCDPKKRGRVLIRDLLVSPVLAELMDVRQDENEEDVEDPALQSSLTNWFHPANITRIYDMFNELDKDFTGTLSKDELAAYMDGNLTSIFIDRVFDEHVLRPKGARGVRREMDPLSFADLVLALESKHTVEGLGFVFKCLDLNHRNYITKLELYTLFRDVHQKWMQAGNYELRIEDVTSEIFDIVKPSDPLRITLEDLVACNQGEVVVSMLIDVGGFWSHENHFNG